MGKGLLVADSDGTVGLSRRLNPRLGEDGSSLVLGEGRVDDKEPKTEDGLGQNIMYSVHQNLHVGRKNRVSMGKVGKKEDDRVAGPDDHGEDGDLAKEAGCLGSDELGGPRALNEELVDDEEQSGPRGGEGDPARLGGVEAGEETKEDHSNVGYNDGEDVNQREAGKESHVEEKEGRGDEPVDISSPVDFSEGSSPDVNLGVSGSDGHEEVGGGGHGGNEDSDPVEDRLGGGDSHRVEDEDEGRDRHDSEGEPEDVLSESSNVLDVGHGVSRDRRGRPDGLVVVLEEGVHAG